MAFYRLPADYVATCIKRYGDRVKHWMVLNEPMVFAGAGYFLGIHAPGRKGLSHFLAAAHHAVLCQALGGRVIKSLNNKLRVGTTFSASYIQPIDDNKADRDAALRTDVLLNRLFAEPLLGLGYPVQHLKILQQIEKYMEQGDEQQMKFDMDFIGVQNYTREVVRVSSFIPYLNARIVKANKRGVETTTMNWEVYPESIYHILKKYAAYPQIKKLIVTENSAAFPDVVINNRVNDPKRIQFLEQYLAQVLKAKHEGVAVEGYFVWTFTDNFEWAEGYSQRFGLVYTDFPSQKRIIKASGYWYQQFLKQANTVGKEIESAWHHKGRKKIKTFCPSFFAVMAYSIVHLHVLPGAQGVFILYTRSILGSNYTFLQHNSINRHTRMPATPNPLQKLCLNIANNNGNKAGQICLSPAAWLPKGFGLA